MKMATFTSNAWVSGVGCQQLKSTRWMGVAHELDFLSPLVTFSLNPIRVLNSGFFFLLICLRQKT
jgi:hypothetical protein